MLSILSEGDAFPSNCSGLNYALLSTLERDCLREDKRISIYAKCNFTSFIHIQSDRHCAMFHIYEEFRKRKFPFSHAEFKIVKIKIRDSGIYT